MATVMQRGVEHGDRTFHVAVWQIEARVDPRRPHSGRDAMGYSTAEAGQFVAVITDEQGDTSDYAYWISDAASLHDTAEAAMDEAVAAIHDGLEEPTGGAARGVSDG